MALLYPNQISGDWGKAMQPITPLSSLSETPSVSSIIEAVTYVSQEYGLNKSELMQTLKCESGFRYNAKNPNSAAFGVAQFMPSTFKRYCKGSYTLARDQLICMGEFWEKGWQFHWSCWSAYFSS